MVENDHIVNCPFCGSLKLLLNKDCRTEGKEFYQIECQECKALGPIDYSAVYARHHWNARPYKYQTKVFEDNPSTGKEERDDNS